ncbi:MAG: hypothetical protein LBH32_03290 [Dysgonamonadaceae bacterium]|jgi:hypothetical protein|nr:hypothetical protein [Dysgonamonadaceae bacterium]
MNTKEAPAELPACVETREAVHYTEGWEEGRAKDEDERLKFQQHIAELEWLLNGKK